MANGTTTFELNGHTAWVWVDRPEKRNAMTDAMWRQFSTILATIGDSGARAVVIAGRGGTFVAGADILEFESTKGTPEAAMASFHSVDQACHLVKDCPIPVIAAIDGFAVGGGLELAVACDFRVVSATARLGITASKLAITPGLGHIARIWEVVGSAHCVDLLMTGRLVGAEEAYAMGLVTEIVPQGEDLYSRAQGLGELLASRAPGSLTWVKKAVRELVSQSLMASVRNDAEEATRAFATEDFHEAMRAFREKRPPIFTGR